MRWLGPYRFLAGLPSVMYRIQHVKKCMDVQIVPSDKLKSLPPARPSTDEGKSQEANGASPKVSVRTPDYKQHHSICQL
ncbi:hypothetical protein M514_12571 [Trichuris suis]|uniref:Uncharacterized protein n=1 Tax=Trichuris suis TaxID=68888 RepID=A0A085LNK7_9BILA|nr:hypothetical protein M513_12571 [Trichuris suis]KFD65076.1 hypothetical protein M514_12571 [Trichuris suis]